MLRTCEPQLRQFGFVRIFATRTVEALDEVYYTHFLSFFKFALSKCVVVKIVLQLTTTLYALAVHTALVVI